MKMFKRRELHTLQYYAQYVLASTSSLAGHIKRVGIQGNAARPKILPLA